MNFARYGYHAFSGKFPNTLAACSIKLFGVHHLSKDEPNACLEQVLNRTPIAQMP